MDAQWRCAGSAAATRRECGDAQVRDDSSSASRRAKQNDATAQPCPARPSRACLASRTNRVPVVTRIGGRGDGAAVDDGPGCRRRADAAALSSRGRDLGGRGPKRRVLRQADGGRAQTSLSWLADTLLSQDRAAPIRFCRPTAIGGGRCGVRRPSPGEPSSPTTARSSGLWTSSPCRRSPSRRCTSSSSSRTPPHRAFQRDGTSDSAVGVASVAGGDAVGAAAPLSDPGPRPLVRRRLHWQGASDRDQDGPHRGSNPGDT